MPDEKTFAVKILATRFVTYDVKQFILEKPENYEFIPGNYTGVSINNPKWKSEERSFTFTSLPDDNVLEFTIKRYKERNGVTDAIHKLNPGDELIIKNPTGAIEYKGPGVFIAGGAGITPFIAILRNLAKENKLLGNVLIFSNKTHKDIILEREFKEYLGDNCIFTLTREDKTNSGYQNRKINESFLKDYIKDFSQRFYICGPSRMVGELTSILQKLGANPDSIVVET